MKIDINRKIENNSLPNDMYKIIIVDDDIEIIKSLYIHLKDTGYNLTSVTNPIDAIEKVRNEHFDLMILDFNMPQISGSEVVEKIREFNKELYILLFAEHKELLSSIDTIKQLDIQGYCEKENDFDQLFLLIQYGIKSVAQMNLTKSINSELQESKEMLEKAYLETIETLRYTVEAKDYYTRGHSDRVSDYSVLIGKKMNLSDEDIEKLHIGGLFHDIGKIGIPDEILLKNDSLTTEEYSEIKKHTSIGAHILSNATLFKELIPIVKYHHERYDGNGYPENLKGEDIPLLARITSVADTFDAMMSKRSYRNALSLEHIKQELKNCSGNQLDPNIVPIFLDILENEYDKIKEIQNKY